MRWSMPVNILTRKNLFFTSSKSADHASNGMANHGHMASPTRHFSPSLISSVARNHGPAGQVVTTYLKQGWVEAQLRWRGIGYFRSNQNQRAVQGYANMHPHEFEAINAVQSWANWRTIPRNLTGRLPSGPIKAIDLCSGTGDSTQVLACYAAWGSHIIGYEIDQRFVQLARTRKYATYDGHPQQVDFVHQDVLAPFKNEQGQLLQDKSIDLINVAGAVAIHFDAQSTAKLAQRCSQAIKPGGLALVDAGSEGASPRVVQDCFETHGFKLIHKARSCLLDFNRQLCFRSPD